MSGKSFGQDFILVNDVQQLLDPKIFKGGPWVHLATVRRGLKEYCAFRPLKGRRAFIEEVDPTEPGLFKQIEDDTEWKDLHSFLLDRGCLLISGIGHELKGGKHGIPGLLS
jgi:hypothetical protein